jgi:hypothetical protein
VATIEEYTPVRSTKVDSLVTILRYHLASDEHGVYQDLDKELTDEELAQLDHEDAEEDDIDIDLPGIMSMGKRKILVYTEFAIMAPLLKSVSVVVSTITSCIRADASCLHT